MKALTFLGATTAWETRYVMPDGREHVAPYFGAALARFYPDLDNMTVFVTEKARAKNWEDFKRRAEDHVANLEAVTIPDGADENELWTLFQSVVDAVAEREEVLFDITHGFRPLPLLSLLAVAYLRQVKNIKLRAVLYGNYEARDQSVQPNRTPVIDLSDFVSLFDWMTAADRFIRFGDAADLAKRLRSDKPDQTRPTTPLPRVITADMLRKSSPRRKDVPDQNQQSNRLARVANSLERISNALRLIRPNEAMDASAKLDRHLSDPVVIHSIESNARPFVLLTESIRNAYKRLALPSIQQREKPVLMLKHERDMIDRLLKHKQYAQAVAIAREWIISWVMFQMDLYDFAARDERRQAEAALAGTTACSVDQIAAARDIYDELRIVRNDLLHAGKNHDALNAQEMKNAVVKVCPRLSELTLSD